MVVPNASDSVSKWCSASYDDSLQGADMEKNSLLGDVLSLGQLGHPTCGPTVRGFRSHEGHSKLCSECTNHVQLREDDIRIKHSW